MESLCNSDCNDGILSNIHEVLRERGHFKEFQPGCKVLSFLTKCRAEKLSSGNIPPLKLFRLRPTSNLEAVSNCSANIAIYIKYHSIFFHNQWNKNSNKLVSFL